MMITKKIVVGLMLFCGQLSVCSDSDSTLISLWGQYVLGRDYRLKIPRPGPWADAALALFDIQVKSGFINLKNLHEAHLFITAGDEAELSSLYFYPNGDSTEELQILGRIDPDTWEVQVAGQVPKVVPLPPTKD
jgi:hypothetical protein